MHLSQEAVGSINISSMYASPIARSASSPRFPSAARWKSNLPSFLAALASSMCQGDVSNLPPPFCRFWARGPANDFELINGRSQSVLPLWPLVYDIVSWPRKLVFVAEAFETL